MLLQKRGKGIRKVALWGAEKMAPSVRCLLHKPEHLSLDLQHPHEKLGIVRCVFNLCAGGHGDRACLNSLISQPNQICELQGQ